MSNCQWMMAALAGAVALSALAASSPADEPAAPVDPSKRIVLRPMPGKMNSSVHFPGRRNWGFSLGIPETIGSAEKPILNFPEVAGKLQWTGPDEAGAVESTWTTEGRIKYTAKLIPAGDYVDVEFAITNLSGKLWTDVWAFNCLNPTAAKVFQDWKLERTYMSAHGRPMLMKGAPRLKGHMPTVQFFLHEQVPWGNESPFVRGFHATSPHRTDGSYIVTLSDPPGQYIAAATLDSVYLFDNLDRCCIHSAANFGDIGPGETSFTVCRFYFADGSLEGFLKRFAADSAALAARQKWARPKAARIKLTPIPPPARGKFGPLGLRIQAAWMQDPIQLRLPETLHSSMGLHFIDHGRRDMPPLSMIEPFPTWQVDEATGQMSYKAVTSEGIEFGARVRPYRDEVYVEFRVKNNTDKPIERAYPQVCLSLAQSRDFGKTEDVTDTYTWIDGKFTSFAKTTPTAKEMHLPPWPQMRTKELGAFKGKLPEGNPWWFTNELADVPLIARVSADGKHMVATAWEGSQGVSSNSRIPCLHSAAPWKGPIAPGNEIVWRGKIYLTDNDPAALLLRYTGDSGKWPYPEGPKPARPQATTRRANRRGD